MARRTARRSCRSWGWARTGNPALPRATAEANAVLMSRPAGSGIDSLVAHGVKAARTIGSPGYPAVPG